MARGASARGAILCLLGCAAALCGSAVAARAGDFVAPARPVITIPRLAEPPRLGSFMAMRPEGAAAERMVRVNGFIQREPEDGRPASQRTDAYLGYDQEHFYAVFVAHDRDPERIRANMARRENLFGDEIVEVQLDTFRDERRAYSFILNPYGVQWDAIWTEGQGFDESWDTVWHSEGTLTETGYVALFAIPFRSLRFPPAERQTWGIVLVRDVPRNNESSFWPRVSSRIEGRMNQAAILEGLEGISPGRNMQFIPYVTARSFDVLDGEETDFARDETEGEIGLDAKFVLRDSLALDLTLNPDFSQVETDDPRVTVNQRFEVFFPEKRPFFLENADFFRTPLDLVFSRRIVEPRGGARLTGKAGPWNIGALAIDDKSPGRTLSSDDDASGEEARFGILRVSRDILRQSNVGVLYAQRTFDGAFNRVGGLDGRIKLNDNWETTFQAVASSTEDLDGNGLSGPAYDLVLNRAGRQLNAHFHYQDVDPGFRTEAGFIPRSDIRDLHQWTEYLFRPEGRRLVAWGPSLSAQRIEDHGGTRLDWSVSPALQWEFRRQTRLGIEARAARERLRPEDFDTLASDRDFSRNEVEIFGSSRFTDLFNVEGEVEWGRGINFVPPDGDPPGPADLFAARMELTFRLLSRLRIDQTYLYTQLSDRRGGPTVFTNQIHRSRWSFQFTPRASLRAILDYQITRADESLTSLVDDRAIVADLLYTYRVNPWTAVFVGYRGFGDVTLVPGEFEEELARRGELPEEARAFFVKISYLIRR